MKKLLALVLALVMTLGLATVGANAAFADADKIEHTEAVEVLNSLGVIGGKENNNFDPSGNVKRSEMAKMVALIMLGDVDDTAFKGAPTDLTDIDGHWAEGWIKYCVSQGIVGGRGNGKFDPDDNVTASEAAKMLLVAIGYNASVQGYTGGQWQVNVARDAQISGFYKQLSSLGANKALTRDEAAQMIYNAADCDQTSHTEQLSSSGERITVYTAKDAALGSLLESAYKVVTVGDSTTTVTITDSKLETSGQYKGLYRTSVYDTGAAAAATYYSSTDYSDLLGQRVVVRFANNDGGAVAAVPTSASYNAPKDELIGIYAYSQSTAIGPFAWGQLERDSDTKIKAAGTVYSLTDEDTAFSYYTVATNGTVNSGAAAAGTAIAANTANKVNVLINTTFPAVANAYSTVKFIDNNGDGKYERAVIYNIQPAKITYTDSNKVIADATTYAKADYIVDENLAKNDYAAISFNFAENKTQLVEIEKQTGKVTATKATNKVQIEGDSTWYVDSTATMAIDSTYDYWMCNGIVYAAEVASAASIGSLVFVSAVDETLNGTQAKVYYPDGTTAVLTVDTSGTNITPGEDTFFTVAETTKGYKFTSLAAKTAKSDVITDYTYQTGKAVTASAGRVGDIDGKDIADDAVIFVYHNRHDGGALTTAPTTAKVITGKQLKSASLAAATQGTASDHIISGSTDVSYFYHSVNGVAKVAYAAVQYESDANDAWSNWPANFATSAAYALVTSAPVSVSGGIQYTIWTGSENLTVIDKSGTAAAAVPKFSLVGYSSVADGEIKDVTAYTMDNTAFNGAGAEYASAALTGFESKSGGYRLFLDGSTTNRILTDGDTVFFNINSGAGTADAIGLASDASLATADTVYGATCQNVIIMTDAAWNTADNTTCTAKVVIVDASNRLATGAATQYTFTGLGGTTVYDSDDNVLMDGATAVNNKVKAGDVIKIVTAAGGAAVYTVGLGDISKAAIDGVYPEVAYATTGATATYNAVVKGNGNITLTGTSYTVTGDTDTVQGITYTLTPDITAIAAGDTRTVITYTLTITGAANGSDPDTTYTFANGTVLTGSGALTAEAGGTNSTVTITTGANGTVAIDVTTITADTATTGTYKFTVRSTAGSANVTVS